MELKHTPGPWGITGSDKNIICELKKIDTTGLNGIICQIWNKNISDINLISAAPEMLEALIKYRSYIPETFEIQSGLAYVDIII